jgi:putative ABC transport system ATP-binding protein
VTEAILRAEGLVRRFSAGQGGFTLVVEAVSLQAGELIATVGPSGCGKSTLLGLLALALRPDKTGVLCLRGHDAAALWQSNRLDALTRLRASLIGFVPQTSNLLPFLDLRANIALPQRILGRPDPGWLSLLAERLGIAHLLGRRPSQVSVGQRQRAAVARALSHRPPLVLADEPTASVHPVQASDILGLLADIARDSGTALLITTHDADRAAAAGFTIAPCKVDPAAEVTHFRFPS